MGDRARKTELFEQLARVGKALANGKRLELLDLLAQSPRSVADLAQAAELGLTTASAHLQVLKQAALVAASREGTTINYRLADGPEGDVAALYAHLRAVATERLPDVQAARDRYLGPHDTEHITRDELLRRARAGQVTVLDVRPAAEYAAAHIPGAISIPLDELPARLAELPADQEIVAYCRGAHCVLAHDAVRLLTTHNRPAKRLTDGILEWRLANLPVAT